MKIDSFHCFPCKNAFRSALGIREGKNDFWDFLNRRIGTTERATKKTITSSERTKHGLSNDRFFLLLFKKYAFLLSVKNR